MQNKLNENCEDDISQGGSKQRESNTLQNVSLQVRGNLSRVFSEVRSVGRCAVQNLRITV